MLANLTSAKHHALRTTLATLLVGTALGAAGVAWFETSSISLVSSAVAAPLGLPPAVHQAGFADLAATVKPAVVAIETTEQATAASDKQAIPQMPSFPQGSPFGDMLRQYFGQQDGDSPQRDNPSLGRALGSGFIIDPAGYIVTNNHVIDGAQEITVTLADGKKYPAKIVGRDSKTDIGLLKIDPGKQLPYLAFGDSDKERVGDWVIAAGNPFGLGGTVTAGILSANGRDINEGPYDNFLQIDAPINPGNSGGPLFNQSGEVIGIDTAIYSPSGGSVGIGFAIPSNLAKNIVAKLREHGKVDRGWLGVQMQPLTPALSKALGLPNDEGVLVDQVEKDSPAFQSKVQQGDVIIAFNGNPIKAPRDLALAVANVPAGKAVDMTLWRKDHQSTINVTIRTQKSDKVLAAGANTDKTLVGMALKSLTPDERNQLNLSPGVEGVVVANVTAGSRADNSGVQTGDVIVRIGDHTVKTPSEVAGDIQTAQQQRKEAIPMLVMRDGTTYYLGLQLATG